MESYKNITHQEARKMMEEENVMVVDVREPDEYAEGHVPGQSLFHWEPLEMSGRRIFLILMYRYSRIAGVGQEVLRRHPGWPLLDTSMYTILEVS